METKEKVQPTNTQVTTTATPEKKNESVVNQQSQQIAITASNMTRGYFAGIADNFINASGLTKAQFEKEVSFILQIVSGNKKMQECAAETFLKAALNVANIGLTLNPVSKLAYLVPRWNSVTRRMEAHLEPSYMGLTKLLTDTGSIKAITATPFYENDFFDVTYGSFPSVNHKPNFKNRGEFAGVYAVATLSNNEKQFEVMTADEIFDVRERSETYKAFKEGKIQSCTWETDFSEMSRKTVIRRIYKYLPKSDKMRKFEEAIQLDTSDYVISPNQIMLIDELLRNCTLSVERKSSIEYELNGQVSAKRAGEIITLLQQNQIPTLNAQYKERLTIENAKEENQK